MSFLGDIVKGVEKGVESLAKDTLKAAPLLAEFTPLAPIVAPLTALDKEILPGLEIFDKAEKLL